MQMKEKAQQTSVVRQGGKVGVTCPEPLPPGCLPSRQVLEVLFYWDRGQAPLDTPAFLPLADSTSPWQGPPSPTILSNVSMQLLGT